MARTDALIILSMLVMACGAVASRKLSEGMLRPASCVPMCHAVHTSTCRGSFCLKSCVRHAYDDDPDLSAQSVPLFADATRMSDSNLEPHLRQAIGRSAPVLQHSESMDERQSA